MIWHYDKDLSGYTLGRGGYYSPQEYLSFSVPVIWRQRTEKLVVGTRRVGVVVPFAHANSGALSVAEFDSVAVSLRSQPAKKKRAAAAVASVIPHGRWWNGESPATGLSARLWIFSRRKITPRATRCCTCAIQLPVGRGDMDMPPQPLVPYADW